ncbi:MAG: hypothetical protein WC351_03405 [Candidatus Izemoplasmatales bacterium]|jgi:hypothetical protein
MKRTLIMLAFAWMAMCLDCTLDAHDQPRSVSVQPEDILAVDSN